jgi:CSLREA domain-containing protein
MINRKVLVILLAGLLMLLSPSALPVSAEPQANTYLVNSKDDVPDENPGDGKCETASWIPYTCTLRAAIEESNADGVPSTINFAQKFAGLDFISGCDLPGITEPDTSIDASDQWDVADDRPGVEISGISCTLLKIYTQGTEVFGLGFFGGDYTGVHIRGGSFNTIGGPASGQRNVFISARGVSVEFNAANNLIAGNYFGTIDGNNAIPSEWGIAFSSGAKYNTVEKNLIVEHSAEGIFMGHGSSSHHNVIQDNIIGADKDKKDPMPNGTGISFNVADQNTVKNNFIVANAGHGIELDSSDGNTITGNEIGAWLPNGVDGGNGGDGIHINNSNDNQVSGNRISLNTGYGMWLNGDSNNLSANDISQNGLDGIYIGDGYGNRIGNFGSNNVINENGASGVHLGPNAGNNTVAGNYIGLSHGAFDAGNQGHGVLIEGGAHNNTIGGSGEGEGNWIGWNNWYGILITGTTTNWNFVLSNVIGAPIHWAFKAPNGNHGIGIYDGAYNNWIGGVNAGNYVLSSSWSGVAIVNSPDNVVLYNYVGTQKDNLTWGNQYHGVAIVNSTGNFIGGNEIAYNGSNGGQAGLQVNGGLAGNPLHTNSIHDNGGPGIELVNGGNFQLGAPSITQASCQGPVTGTTCYGCQVEIFSDFADEGRIYEGSTTSDANTGFFSWSGTVNGPNVTATATTSTGLTSSFSVPFAVGECNTAPVATFTANPISGPAVNTFKFDASGSIDSEDAASALEVRWDWENDGFYDTVWSTTKVATHTFPTPGEHTTRLQVRDTGGLTDTVTQQVSVLESVFLPFVVK